jgi:hypothetical protein
MNNNHIKANLALSNLNLRRYINMKASLVILAGVLLAFAVLGVVHADAATSNVQSSVTVNGYVSVTITVNPLCSGTMNFTSGNPGDVNKPVTCQNVTAGAVSVRNDPISNGNIAVDTTGLNFTSGGNKIAITNVAFDRDNTAANKTAMAESPVYKTVYTGVTPGQSKDVWYWMNIPSGQASGSYTTTITVRGQ